MAKCVPYFANFKQELQNQIKGPRKSVPLKRFETIVEDFGENPFEMFRSEEGGDLGSVIGKRAVSPMWQQLMLGKRNNKYTGLELI